MASKGHSSTREFFFLFASSFFYSRVLFLPIREFFSSIREIFLLFASSFFYSRILFSTREFFSFYSHVLFSNSQVLLSAREFLFLLASSFIYSRVLLFCSRVLFFALAIDSGLIGISTTCVWRLRKMAANYSG